MASSVFIWSDAAPVVQVGSATYTLPTADGTSGQALTTNGSGTLSWSAASTAGDSDQIILPTEIFS
jgi:hypothetical protein